GRFSVTSIYQWKPYTFEVYFQVLDIPETHNFLLGRPWVHSAGLSSLKPESENQIHRSGSSGNSSCRRRPDSPPILFLTAYRWLKHFLHVVFLSLCLVLFLLLSSGVGRAFYVYPIWFLDSETNSTASFSCRLSLSIISSPLCSSFWRWDCVSDHL
ncbi:L-type lectin-domain containing receptor kinase S.6, partial [Striga hermonthica]